MSQPVNPPVTVITSQTYESYNVFQTTINLNTSAWFVIQIYDPSGNLATTKSLLMDGDAYKAWGGDDNYVYTWINQQLQQI
jgi:hypothetical protein